ncbi:putative galacturonosyltransferase 4 [Camellia lanceoleosa]|uniref:Galacturonosyltransferase 4 n=1 Tax=Camellia lanceoleosa TaxID=1840588 RepID=A0ACC0GG05_9ERIC|nr:putative galacturonosyltransferase 4 [Camellia lanceoleosa]
MVIKMKLRKPVVLLLLFTVLAPIVLYTDRLGTFKSSSSRDEFIEDVSTFVVMSGPESASPGAIQNLKEPLGMVYLENSSLVSLSDSSASTGENSRKTRQLTEESAEHLNTVSNTTNGTGDRHPEEKNPIRQVTEQGHKPGLTDQNENREQENVKDKMGKVGVSEDTSTSTSNNAAVNLETKLEKQSAKTSVKFGAGEPIKTKIEKQNDKTVMPSDARVRHLKDQLIQGRVYLSLTATRNNPHFIRELRLRMKEAQRSLGEATKDSELPRNSVEKLKALEQTLAKGKQIQDDCTAMVKKLRAMLHSTEEQLRVHKKQTLFLTHLTTKTLPKGLHCLPLRLSTKYFSLNSSERNFPNQEKLEGPRLYHYALFTDNILAAAVVNSTISHAKLNKVLFLDDDIVVLKDLTGLWSLDLKGKVNGAVETCGETFHRFDRYLNFSNSLISKKFDPHACGWAFGMNIFDLEEWKRQNITEVYHSWQNLNHDRQLWKLGTLPPGLVTFWNRTYSLDRFWHVLGLGYNPNVSPKEIERAAVIHYNGNLKPWLEIGIPKFRSYWAKFVDYDHLYLRECNINP